MKDNHSKFLDHLDASRPAVFAAAEWLNNLGYTISLPPISRADKHENWKDHADSGDLMLSQRVEVKHLGVDFNNRGDWPFKDKFIVCAKHSFDMAKPKPYCYLIINKPMTRVAIVMSSDSLYWTVEKRKDSRYVGVEQELYFSPLEKVTFKRMSKN